MSLHFPASIGEPLNINGLSKNYESTAALRPLTLQLKAGEIFGLLGPNGAGKTTLISVLTGLIPPTAGTASIMGYDILKDGLNARKMVGLVPQEIISHGFFSVEQVLDFHSGYYGLKQNWDRINYLLDKLALKDHRQKLVAQLSGGMKRRLLIAKALVHSPPLLLLDEPTAGVDVELRNALWTFVRELNEEGQTILLTTHYLQEAEELCNRVGVLNNGELIALDKTQTLIRDLTQRQISLTLTQSWQNNMESSHMKVEGNVVTANIPYDESVGELIQKLKIPLDHIRDIAVTEGRLEDAFVQLMRQHN